MMPEQYERRKSDEYLAEIKLELKYIRRDVDGILQKLEKDYVTQDQFDPIKRIVYGLVSLILIAVVGAVLALVIR